MNCPDCGAPMQLAPEAESFTCKYCGNVYFPEPNDEGVRILDAAAEKCPVCGVPLMHAAIAAQRIRYCAQCRGMLLGMDRFTELTGDMRARRVGASGIPQPPDPHELDRKLRCPQCGTMMDTHPYAGPGNIIIDDCERCELIWLDQGELERVARAPDRTYGAEI